MLGLFVCFSKGKSVYFVQNNTKVQFWINIFTHHTSTVTVNILSVQLMSDSVVTVGHIWHLPPSQRQESTSPTCRHTLALLLIHVLPLSIQTHTNPEHLLRTVKYFSKCEDRAGNAFHAMFVYWMILVFGSLGNPQHTTLLNCEAAFIVHCS